MLWSASKQIAFIHIPKTAGWSVYAALKQYIPASDWQDGSAFVTNPMFRLHMTAAEAARFIPEWPWLFSFVVVRNPWDRIVSSWAHYTKKKISFAAYIDQDLGLRHNWRTQVHYLLDHDGHQLVNSIVRYEAIDAELTGLIGLRDALVYFNKSEHEPYQSYYSPRLVQVVADRFILDIERFGYTFDEG